MKVGIIRCMQTEDMCPGSTDFAAIRGRKGVFSEIDGDIELVGFVNCGGGPGKKIPRRAKMLASHGAEAVCLAACIGKGTPIGYPCPFHDKIMELLKKSLPNVRIFDHTH